jgi:hypothetical protein
MISQISLDARQNGVASPSSSLTKQAGSSPTLRGLSEAFSRRNIRAASAFEFADTFRFPL